MNIKITLTDGSEEIIENVRQYEYVDWKKKLYIYYGHYYNEKVFDVGNIESVTFLKEEVK